MTIHTLKLQPKSFDKIKSKEKTIEVRLYDERRKGIRPGDVIEFKKEPEQIETIRTEVIGVLNYRTFADLANDFDGSYFGHEQSTDLLKNIYNFYTKEQEAEHTVLGIRIKLLE
jgi:ASC-1-like (ASCH) protein